MVIAAVIDDLSDIILLRKAHKYRVIKTVFVVVISTFTSGSSLRAPTRNPFNIGEGLGIPGTPGMTAVDNFP